MNPLPCCPRFPAPPAGIRIPVYVGQAGTQNCTVGWDAVPGANMYQLEKKNPDGTYELWYEGSATQYTKTGLFCGASPAPFTVRVRAGNEAGWGPWTPDTVLQATQICVTAPAMPANLRIVSCTKTAPNATTCTIAWDPVSGASNYRLEKKRPDGTYELWYSGSGTSYTRSGLYCGPYSTSGPFVVRVRAEGPGGTSGWNEKTLYTTPCPEPVPAKPGAPWEVSQRCTSLGYASLTIAWSPVAGATSYKIWHVSGELLGTTTGTQFTITNKPSGPAGAYLTVQVEACNSAGCSGKGPSKQFYLKPCQPPAKPGAPYKVSQACVSRGRTNITIGWSSVYGATSYKLYHVSGELKGTTSGTQLTLYNQQCGTSSVWTANFYVVACNSYGCSGPGSTGTISFPVCP